MMADFAMPVPAAGAPAFWTKNISSVAGYLVNESISRLLCHPEVDCCWDRNIPHGCFVEYGV
jgi:hypothetical protein